MKKLIFFFFAVLSLEIGAQTIIPHRGYLVRQVWNGDTIDQWMSADTLYFYTNQIQLNLINLLYLMDLNP
jgi:hypothetical protein